MSRTFSYNPDYIVPVIQMQFIQNPFEKQCVKLDPSWTPPQPLHHTLFSYDFAFEEEMLAKSREQLQDVFSNETCSTIGRKESEELVIPIENLIANANFAPSTLELIPNGNSSQVNIEDFDSHNTDPFQEAQLKTINDLEELQTLIIPPLQPQDITNGETADRKESALQEVPSELELEIDSSAQAHHEQNITSSPPRSMEEITPGSDKYYMNINALPSATNPPELTSESLSPKPPVPAPRKLKGNPVLAPSSPTPIPRLSAPKAPIISRPTPADFSNSPPTILSEANSADRTQSYVLAVDAPPPAPPAGSAPPDYVETPNQEFTYPQGDQTRLFVKNLTVSLERDINSEVNVYSPILPLPPTSHPYRTQSPLSEDIFYGKIASMGFPLDCVKNISESFNTKDEGRVVEHVLAIQNVAEGNKWPLGLVETAYIIAKGEIDKMKPYIETFLKYKEMGFADEKIHSALGKCGKEYEKMLEILIENS